MALDQETIVRTALRLLDREGFDGVSLRKIAAELGVQAPALYWHFKNKQALLDEMATTVLADHTAALVPAVDDTEWREWAQAYGEGLRRMLLRYRDGAKMFSGTHLTDPTMYAPMEAALAAFVGYGFSLTEAARGLATIYFYTVGFTIEEQAVFPRPGERDPRYEPATRAARIEPRAYPLALAVGEVAVGQYDERFAAGLALIIAGIEATCAPQPYSADA